MSFLAKKKLRGAFTLLELLVIMTIIGIMAGLLGPSLVSILQGRGTTRAIDVVSEFLETSRNHAMAKNTYVFVGFAERTNSNENAELVIAEMISKNGLPDSSSANLVEELRPAQVENVILNPIAESGSKPLENGSFQFTLKVGGKVVTFGKVIAFTPRGEAILNRDAAINWISVNLQQRRGQKNVDTNKASIWISGVSGRQLVMRQGAK